VGKSAPYQSFPVWFVQPKLPLLQGGKKMEVVKLTNEPFR